MEQLALAYRPRTFDDLVGQRVVQVILRRMVDVNKIPHALLFDGSRGTGKTTTARILAAALNCDTPPGPCQNCVSCKAVHNGTSLDVVEIDAASNGLVDDIRRLREQVMYRVGGRYRVVILDEAHSMSTAAFNALLKTLEEPPPATVFILLTTEPGRIPDTVTSRCMPFSFRRLTPTDIVARLAHICRAEQFTVEVNLLQLIAARADGAMRDAVMMLDQVTRAGITTAAAYADLTGTTDIGADLLTHMVQGDIPATFAALDQQLTRTGNPDDITAALIAALRDVLILRCGGDLTHTGAALHTRQNLALGCENNTILTALKVLWDLKTKIRVADDARAHLELAVVMVGQVLARANPVPSTAKITLADMQRG